MFLGELAVFSGFEGKIVNFGLPTGWGRPLKEAALAAGVEPEDLYSALRENTPWSRQALKAVSLAKWRVHDVLTGRLPLPDNARTARYLLAYYELQEERGA